MSNIKILKKEGRFPGKRSVIIVGVHGNEIPGIAALDEIFPEIKIEWGEVIFIYANLEAIKQNRRYIENNLNRCFLKEQPPNITNSLEGKTARDIMPYLDSADIMLDLHSSNIKDSPPFIICDERQVNAAKLFESEFITYNWDIFEPGSTDNYMNLQNKPCFCFEAGFCLDERSITRSKRAIIDFLIFAGNISGKLKENNICQVLKINSLYKNYNSSFIKKEYKPDFWRAEKEEIMGVEGDKEVKINKGEFILFLKDCVALKSECFLTAEETLINDKNRQIIGDKK